MDERRGEEVQDSEEEYVRLEANEGNANATPMTVRGGWVYGGGGRDGVLGR